MSLLKLVVERLQWFSIIYLTYDYRLRFTFDSHSCTCTGSYFHVIYHSHLQPAHHHRAYGCIHCFIYMETGLIPKTPDLMIKEKKSNSSFYFHAIVNDNSFGIPEANLVLLDDAVLVVWGRRVPGDADGSTVLVSHR